MTSCIKRVSSRGQVIKAMDQKSIGVSPAGSNPADYEVFFFYANKTNFFY